MATTNRSKVDRLPLELRVGVAMRLMDRIGYEGIREWLRSEKVAEDALPSDRAFRTFTDEAEYTILKERRLEQIPELQGKSSLPGAHGAASEAIQEPHLLTVLMNHSTARLRISERLAGEFDAVSQRAERAEARILADLERAWEDGIDIVPRSGIAISQEATEEANKESYPHYLGSYADATLFRAALCLPDADPSALMLASLHMQRRDRLAGDRRMLRPNVMLRLISMLLTMMGHMRRGGFLGPLTAGGETAKGTMAQSAVTGTAKDGAMGAAPSGGPDSGATVKAGASLPLAWLSPKPGTASMATPPVAEAEEEPCAECEAERRAAEAEAKGVERSAVGTVYKSADVGPVDWAAEFGITQRKTDSVALCADSVGFSRDSVSAGAAAPAAVASGGVGPVGKGLEGVIPGSMKHQMLQRLADAYMAMVENAPPGIAEAALTRILMEYGVSLADATAAGRRIASGELDRDGVLALMVRLTSPGAGAAGGEAVSALRA